MRHTFLRAAFRNLHRNPRRTGLTVLSVAFGVMVVIWTQALLAGRNRNMIDTVISTKTGNVQIARAEYWSTHQIQDFMGELPVQLQSELPPGAAASARVYLPAIVSSGNKSASMLLTGVHLEDERRVTSALGNRVAGEELAPESDPLCPSQQIYIGRALAKVLDAKPGSRLVVMLESADGSLGNDLFIVRGIFDSGSPELDKTLAFTPLACARKIGALTGVHEIAVRLRDDADSIPLAHRLGERLGADYKVTYWRETLPMLNSILQLNDAMVLMLSLILMVMISMGMVNSIMVSILERTREFGVLLALGLTPWQLVLMVVLEGALIAAVGSVIGVTAGSLAVFYHAWRGFDLSWFFGNHTSVGQFKLDLIIHPVFSGGFSLKVVVLTFVIVTLVSLIPTARISRLKPMEALRA